MELDKALVSLGIKGQDAVLSTLDRVQKKRKSLEKASSGSIPVGSVKETGKASGAGNKSVNTFTKSIDDGNKKLKQFTKEITAGTKKQKEYTTAKPGAAGSTSGAGVPSPETEKKWISASKDGIAKPLVNAVKTFSSSVTSLDPVSAIQGLQTAMGTALSGISVLGISLGRVPEGIADLNNNLIGMAKTAVDMSKQSTAAYHELATRNAATRYYGAGVNQGVMSNAERASLISTISGSFGKIQKPLFNEINKLIPEKDTGALARVGAGDWRSTGTDKGFFLQKLSDSFGDLPPSIAQKFQAKLLAGYGSEIQNYEPEQKEVQRRAGEYANMSEAQTKKLYDRSDFDKTKKMIEALNTMQIGMYNAGIGLNHVIVSAAEAIATLPKQIDTFKKSLNDFSSSPSMKGLRQLIPRASVAGKK